MTNLTNRPVYQKSSTSEGKPPTMAQRVRWRLIRELGCIVKGCLHRRPAIHHCDTGAGGRKNHDKVLGLCHDHHQGRNGIHKLGRKVWEAINGTEAELMAKTSLLLGERKND